MKVRTGGVFLWLGAAMLSTGMALASSITGSWVSMDDKTGVKRAVVHLFIQDGILNGRIEKVYPQPGDTGICNACPGELKDKPVLGLQIIWGLKKQSPHTWIGGEILDAKTGKIYHVHLRMKGNKLYVRGYVGVSILGRTQVWLRDETTNT